MVWRAWGEGGGGGRQRSVAGCWLCPYFRGFGFVFPDLHLKTAKASLWKVREPLAQHLNPAHVYCEYVGACSGPQSQHTRAGR